MSLKIYYANKAENDIYEFKVEAYTLGRTHVHILVRGEPMLTAIYSEAR